MSRRVGFIGLGLMGRPMARNLMKAGHDLAVYNRSPGKADALVAEGAEGAAGIPGLARSCDVIITMLPGPPEIREVLAGEDGVIENAREGSLVVEMSTSSPALARELSGLAQEKGIGVLDAPVSGGDVGAKRATLSIMVGGPEEDFARARPMLGALGETIVHVGGAGAGQTVKAANQVVIALIIEAVSEALVLGSKAGVEPERILEVLSGGMASNRVIDVKREKLLGGGFSPGGKAESQYKDLGIALQTAREHGVPLPLTALVDQLYAALVAGGDGGLDHSALITLIRRWSSAGGGE